jgi:GGDEF domain-containing protein
VLKVVAEALRQSFYRSDLCARLYGAHFAVLVFARERPLFEESLRAFFASAKEHPSLKNSVELIAAALRIGPEETMASLMGRGYEALGRVRDKGGSPFFIEE